MQDFPSYMNSMIYSNVLYAFISSNITIKHMRYLSGKSYQACVTVRLIWIQMFALLLKGFVISSAILFDLIRTEQIKTK